MTHGDPDGTPGMAVCIGINDEDADLVPHFQNSVIFQLIDCGADGGRAELECLAEKILWRQSISPFHLLVSDISDKQGFRLFCLFFDHRIPLLKTKNSLQYYYMQKLFFVKIAKKFFWKKIVQRKVDRAARSTPRSIFLRLVPRMGI